MLSCLAALLLCVSTLTARRRSSARVARVTTAGVRERRARAPSVLSAPPLGAAVTRRTSPERSGISVPGTMVMLDVSSLLAATVIFLASVVLLYNTWPTFRYHARFTAFTILLMIGSCLPIPLMLRRPRDSKNALLPARSAIMVSHLLGLEWEVRGHENTLPNKGCVVLINHQSAIDLFVLAQLWPLLVPCAVISKKEVMYLGPFGLATWLWGTIFIDRLNPGKARSAVDKTSHAVQEGKMKLLMFPEGTRNSGEELLPFKKGAFHVALTAQAPILPVVVSRYHFLDSKTKKFGKGKVILTLLPPIETKGLGRDDLEHLVEDTRGVMQAEYRRVSAEAKAWSSGHESEGLHRAKVNGEINGNTHH